MQPKTGQHESAATVNIHGRSFQNNGRRINIGISGKRFISLDERAKVYEEIKKRITEILEQHQALDFVAFTALALGADTIFAQVVTREFQKPLHVVLPFSIEEYQKDFPEQELKTFYELLNESSETEVASAPLPVKPEDRSLGYFTCGRRIVDACDDMIFVWDEQKPGGTGGTGEIMGYFAEKNIDQHATYIKVSPDKQDPLDAELMKGYEESNFKAIKARDLYRLVWKSAIIFGWLALSCFAVKTAFHIEETGGFALSFLELVFAAVVFLLIYFARKRDYHGVYLEKRCEAETYRLLKIFYHTGVKVKTSDQSSEEGTAFSKLADRINKQLQQNAGNLKWYSQYVIKNLIQSQLEYHDDKIMSIGNKQAMYNRSSRIVGVAFLINLAVHVVHLWVAGDRATQTTLYDVSVLLNMLLPATYAALEGFIYFNEWAALKKYSSSTSESLLRVGTYLPKDVDGKTIVECHTAQAGVLNFISGIMLTDNKNWKALLQNKDNYHLII